MLTIAMGIALAPFCFAGLMLLGLLALVVIGKLIEHWFICLLAIGFVIAELTK